MTSLCVCSVNESGARGAEGGGRGPVPCDGIVSNDSGARGGRVEGSDEDRRCDTADVMGRLVEVGDGVAVARRRCGLL